ncbi:MAG: DegV family protein [Lachnospiraceae bacterium]|jgi:DegV family protein with EDD domain
MDKKFCIISDGSCDLPDRIVKEMELDIVHFLVSFDGNQYKKEGVEIDLNEFYQRMIDDPKTYPMTAAPSPQDFYTCFERRAKEGSDILCICISSKLSSSLQSAQIAKEMLKEAYPDIRVEILNSLSCTLMQGAYVLEVCRLRDSGYTLDQTIEIMEELIKSGRILFTVGNLDYLYHGGRIGKVTNIAGTFLNVKPLITLENGEIHSSGIKRGRKNSLNGVIELLISYLKEHNCTPDDCTILIGYCHDTKEAEKFQTMTIESLSKVFGTVSSMPLCKIGATIGVHAGPYSIGYGLIRRSDRR